MTYVIHCDWCGKRLHEDDYAKFEIHVERQSVRGELDRKWAREVKPARFFCVTSTRRDEANRMGLPLDSFEPGADCYERAIAAITGVASDRPDVGMEWRLVEVEPDRHKRNCEQVRERTVSARTEEFHRTIERQKQQNKDNAGPDGIGLLMLHPVTCSSVNSALVHAGADRTIAQLEAMSDDELLQLDRIGQGRVREIRETIDRYRSSVATPANTRKGAH